MSTRPSVDHSPDTPFGCGFSWGPLIGMWGGDARLHICNNDQLTHDGPHVCQCGDVYDKTLEQLGFVTP